MNEEGQTNALKFIVDENTTADRSVGITFLNYYFAVLRFARVPCKMYGIRGAPNKSMRLK